MKPKRSPRTRSDVASGLGNALEKRIATLARSAHGPRVLGDFLVGLSSNGLHANGYTVARRVLLGKAKLRVTDKLPGSRRLGGRIIGEVAKGPRGVQFV